MGNVVTMPSDCPSEREPALSVDESALEPEENVGGLAMPGGATTIGVAAGCVPASGSTSGSIIIDPPPSAPLRSIGNAMSA